MTAADDLELLAAQMNVTVAPALVTAVAEDDARLVEQLLTGLDRRRLYALAVVLAAANPDVGPRPPREQSKHVRQLEDYAYCRWDGDTVAEAAVRVGITVSNAHKNYEPAITMPDAEDEGAAA